MKNDVNIIFPSKEGAFKNTLSQMKVLTGILPNPSYISLLLAVTSAVPGLHFEQALTKTLKGEDIGVNCSC